MAHFAEIKNNVVVRVVVVNNDQEHRGQELLANDLGLGGTWVQCSYNNKFRKQFPQVGYVYDTVHDVFLKPRPGEQFELDENHDWQCIDREHVMVRDYIRGVTGDTALQVSKSFSAFNLTTDQPEADVFGCGPRYLVKVIDGAVAELYDINDGNWVSRDIHTHEIRDRYEVTPECLVKYPFDGSSAVITNYTCKTPIPSDYAEALASKPFAGRVFAWSQKERGLIVEYRYTYV